MDIPRDFVDSTAQLEQHNRWRQWAADHPPGRPKSGTPPEEVQAELAFPDSDSGFVIPTQDETGPITEDPTVLRRFATALLTHAAIDVKKYANSPNPEHQALLEEALMFLSQGRPDVKVADFAHILADMEFLLDISPDKIKERVGSHFYRFTSLAGLHKEGASLAGKRKWKKSRGRALDEQAAKIRTEQQQQALAV